MLMKSYSADKKKDIELDGNELLVRFNLVEETKEVMEGEVVTQWVCDEYRVRLQNTPTTDVLAELPEYKQLVKQLRDEKISKLIVTTVSGKVFDADEKSRQRMADAILASETTGLPETQWKLADNTVSVVTYTELREAHALALQALGVLLLGS